MIEEDVSKATSFQTIRSEMISSCDEYLKRLEETVAQTQNDYEKNHINLSPVDRWETRKFLGECNSLIPRLRKKRILIANAQSVHDLYALYNSFSRQTKSTYRKVSKGLHEEFLDLFFK